MRIVGRYDHAKMPALLRNTSALGLANRLIFLSWPKPKRTVLWRWPQAHRLRHHQPRRRYRQFTFPFELLGSSPPGAGEDTSVRRASSQASTASSGEFRSSSGSSGGTMGWARVMQAHYASYPRQTRSVVHVGARENLQGSLHCETSHSQRTVCRREFSTIWRALAALGQQLEQAPSLAGLLGFLGVSR